MESKVTTIGRMVITTSRILIILIFLLLNHPTDVTATYVTDKTTEIITDLTQQEQGISPGVQILERVIDHLDNFMNAPVQAIRRAQRFLHAGGFPSLLKAEDFDFISKWLWMELPLFVYFGTEDGSHQIYNDPGVGANHLALARREPGFSGYPTDPVPEESLKHWTACLDENGNSRNCTLPEGSLYVKCIDDCNLKECEDISQDDCEIFSSSGDRATCTKEVKWCQQYDFQTVPPGENRGFVPWIFSCINQYGAPDQTKGDILVGDSYDDGELGNCYYPDGVTLVNHTKENNYTSCGEGKQCNIHIGAYQTNYYDSRLRPWYIKSKGSQRPVWTEPYVFTSNIDIGITFTEPIYDTEGLKKVFKGVFAVDYTLEDIRLFLLQFRGSGFMVAVVEAQAPHYVVATSTGSHVTSFVDEDNSTKECDFSSASNRCIVNRVTINDMNENPEDDVLRRSFEIHSSAGFPILDLIPFKVSDNLGDPAYLSTTKTFEQPNANLKWHIIVAVPMEQSSTDAVYVGSGSFYAILTISIIGFVFCLALFSVFIRLRRHRSIQNSDWRFTSAFLFGCSMWNLSSLSLLGKNSDELCMLRMWSFNFCYAAAFSPLYVKVWRMHKLLHASSNFRRVTVTNFQALLYTLPIIAAEVVILTTFSFVDPPRAVEDLPDEFGQVQTITCQHETNAFIITQGVFHFVLIIIGCVLAWDTRDLDPRFGEAKQLAFAMYNTAFSLMVFIIIRELVDLNTQFNSIMLATVAAWISMFNGATFVVPRFMEIQRRKAKLNRQNTIHFGKDFVKRGNHEVLVESSHPSEMYSSTLANPKNMSDSDQNNVETNGANIGRIDDVNNGAIDDVEEKDGSDSDNEIHSSAPLEKNKKNKSVSWCGVKKPATELMLSEAESNHEEEIVFE